MEKLNVTQVFIDHGIEYQERYPDLLYIMHKNGSFYLPCTQELAQGFGFHSFEAYLKENIPCYVSEYNMGAIDSMWEENLLYLERGDIDVTQFLTTIEDLVNTYAYTRSYFLKICYGWKSLADKLFDLVDWQSPDMLLSEFSLDEMLYTYLDNPTDDTCLGFFKGASQDEKRIMLDRLAEFETYGAFAKEDLTNLEEMIRRH